jgi:hypothetical protein
MSTSLPPLPGCRPPLKKGTGNCYDNAVAESFFHTLQTAEVCFRWCKEKEIGIVHPPVVVEIETRLRRFQVKYGIVIATTLLNT